MDLGAVLLLVLVLLMFLLLMMVTVGTMVVAPILSVMVILMVARMRMVVVVYARARLPCRWTTVLAPRSDPLTLVRRARRPTALPFSLALGRARFVACFPGRPFLLC